LPAKKQYNASGKLVDFIPKNESNRLPAKKQFLANLQAEKQYNTQTTTAVRRQRRCSTLPAKKKKKKQAPIRR
jgi:hypothetical protein